MFVSISSPIYATCIQHDDRQRRRSTMCVCTPHYGTYDLWSWEPSMSHSPLAVDRRIPRPYAAQSHSEHVMSPANQATHTGGGVDGRSVQQYDDKCVDVAVLSRELRSAHNHRTLHCLQSIAKHTDIHHRHTITHCITQHLRQAPTETQQRIWFRSSHVFLPLRQLYCRITWQATRMSP